MSNPKLKAKELYCKYTHALNIRDLQITANPFAKQCALVAVDLVLGTFIITVENLVVQYWQEVKEEIIKL